MSVETLSVKERALYDKVVDAGDDHLLLTSLNSSEMGTLGKLKFLGVEVYKNYDDKKKYVRFKRVETIGIAMVERVEVEDNA